MEGIGCVGCYRPRGVLHINPSDGTETPQGQMRENNNLLRCEKGDRMGKRREKRPGEYLQKMEEEEQRRNIIANQSWTACETHPVCSFNTL